MSPALVLLAAVAGVAFAVLAVLRPRVSLLVLVVTDVGNLIGVFAEQLGVGIYRPQLVLAVAVLGILAWRRRLRLAWSPVLLGLLVLMAGFCLSFVAAADPLASQAVLLGRGRDAFYCVVVLALVLSTDSVTQVVKAAVLTLAALAALSVVHQFLLQNQGELFGLSNVPLEQEEGSVTPRHSGTSVDVNFWARLLVLVTPLSLSAWAVARGRPARLLWAGCAVSLALGVFLTQSRGGFLALFVAVVAWLFLAGGRYRRSLLLVPLVLAVLLPVSGIGSRLGTLGDVTATSTAGADPSVVARERLQLDALRMFADSPVVGHGIGSFQSLFPRYDRLSNYYQPLGTVGVAAHNFYLEQAADGGVLLLLAWAIFLGTILFCAARARALARRAGDRTADLLALGVSAAVVGWLAASIFLHLSDFRVLLLLGVLAAALDVQQRRGALPDPPTPLTAPRHRRREQTLELGLAVAAALSLVGLVGALATGSTQYRSVSTLALVPTDEATDAAGAYQLDLISRGLILPTLTAALDAGVTPAEVPRRAGAAAGPEPEVVVSQSRLGGALVVTVTAATPRTAADAGSAAVTLATTQVAALDSGYRLTGEAGDPQPVEPARRWLGWLFALTLVGAAATVLRLSRAKAGRLAEARSAYLQRQGSAGG